MMTSSRYSPECFGNCLRPMSSMMTRSGVKYLRRGLVLLVEGFVFHEVPDRVEDGTVEHREVHLEGLVTEGLGQMDFADAGRAEEQNIFGFADELAAGQIENLLFVNIISQICSYT